MSNPGKRTLTTSNTRDGKKHIPVLLKEVLDVLAVKPGKVYVDATFGAGGHAAAILAKGAQVIGIDRDGEAIRQGKVRFAQEIQQGQLELCHNRFDCLKAVVGHREIDGVVFDLGMSTEQIFSGRGFSFQDETLDMRMNGSGGVTAADLINGLRFRELVKLFETLGEEPYAKKIAAAIVAARKTALIRTARELAQIVQTAVVKRGKIHPATRIFQALRMAVNDERRQLRVGLDQAEKILRPGGRIVVVSFHSLEDRITKQFGKEMEEKGILSVVTKKPIRPSQEEVQKNPSSRSAKMRVFDKAA